MNISSANPAAPLTSSPNPSVAPDSDENVVRLAEVYQEHSASLVRHLTRGTGCCELARDLVHETFVTMLRIAPGGLARIDQAGPYIRQASVNLLRTWRKTEAFREGAMQELGAGGERLVDQVAVLESRDLLRRLEQAISKLKPRTREIFLAHRIEGLSYAEIAERTGLSVKGVEKQMGRAIAKIDRFLDRD